MQPDHERGGSDRANAAGIQDDRLSRVSSPDRSSSQLELTEHLYQQDFERSSNSIEVLVGRLRRRLGQDIHRVARRGFGHYIEAA